MEVSITTDHKSLLSRKSFGSPFGNKRLLNNLLPKIEDRPNSQASNNKDSPLKPIVLSAFQRAKKKIQFWIRNKSFQVDDAFREIAALALGQNPPQENILKFDEFKKGLSKVLGLNLEKDEVS